MKESRFRVFNKKTNKWIYGPGEEVNLFGEVILLCEFMRGVGLQELNDCVVLQYTGLKDKNSREIYEGDLINFTLYGIPHGPEAEDIKNAEVWYDEQYACFCFGRYRTNDNFGYHYDMSDRIRPKSIEVVGNIFDKKD